MRALLAVLVARAGRVVPVGALAELVWDGAPPVGAEVTLRSHVLRLRRALGPRAGARLVTRPPGYLIEADPGEVDLLQFSVLCGECGAAAAAGAWEQAAGLAGEALGLWRGEPLADIASQALAQEIVPRLERLRVQVLEWNAEAGLRLGRHRELVPGLEELVAGHRLQERFHALLMLALYRAGRPADALAAYQAAREVLADELGTDPGAELQALHQQILTSDPALTPPRPRPAETAAPATVAAPGVGVRFSLPPGNAAFTGRDAELERITSTVVDRAQAGGVVAIQAIGGMPGVGKTALAVHAAHTLAGQFPDRQLFIDLHAHTPGREPAQPEDALAGLLAAVGVDPRFLPEDLDGRAGLWRDRMATQRALLVLDNAASSAQVAPLLPGGRDCLVLVTSRRHLGDLPGMVVPVLLDALPARQAATMFTRLASRAAADPAAVAEVVRLAGFLPLAVSLLARVFARHPAWTLADLAADTRESLLTLPAEKSSIVAAFELSYRYLSPDHRRLFALLGLHPGTTADRYAAAALGRFSPAEAGELLDGLHGEGLLTETGYRRYGMHDLLRRYARDQATTLPGQDAQEALGRLLDYYQHTAGRADALIARWTRPGLPPAAPAKLAEVPDLADEGQALAWVRAERASLLACLDHATRTGQHARVVALTAGLAGLLRRDGPWADAITRHTTALQAAQHLGDQPGHANALHELGYVLRQTGDYPGAAQALEQALEIFRGLGDQLSQASALRNLGSVRRLTGDYPGAAKVLEQALGIFRGLGDQLGQAGGLLNLGIVRRLRGDYPGAARDLEQALGIFRDLGNPLGHASALHNLGSVRLLTGDHPGAAQAMEQALGIFRDIGHKLSQVHAPHNLGSVRLLTGDYPGAARALEQALGTYRDLGDQLGQASALHELGMVRALTGDYLDAAQALEQALGTYRDLGHQLGQADALLKLGVVRGLTGDYPGAAQALEQALDIFRDLGDQLGQANALNNLGVVRRVTGDYPDATRALEQALGIFRDLGDQPSQASALHGLRGRTGDCPGADQALGTFRDLGSRDDEAGAPTGRGTSHRASGELTRAEGCHRQALELARAISSPWAEAHALAGLGHCALDTGHTTQAQTFLRTALEIFQRIGAAEAPGLRAELDALTSPRPRR